MPSPTPSTQFAPFKAGTETAVLTPGTTPDEDLVAMVPLTEPGTVGPPPIAPNLVKRVEAPAAWPVSRVRCGSGQVVTAALEPSTGGNPRTSGWRLTWGALDQEQKDLLVGWLVNQVGICHLAMSIEVDGEGVGGATVLRIRPTERFSARCDGMGIDGGGVWMVETVGEEVV